MRAMFIRPYRPADYDVIIDICRLTGAGGQDATPRLERPELMGAVWAAPYVEFEPEHAIVIEDDAATVVGYALGAVDTVAFEDILAQKWWPHLQQKYPLALAKDVPAGFLDRPLIERIHAAPRTDAALTDEWPAHLHIDLLPAVQGKGMGRKTMTALLDLLRDAGAPGVHLGVDPANTGAIAFYERLGYERFAPNSSMFVMKL